MLTFETLTEKNVPFVAEIDALSLGEEGWSENLYRQEIGDENKVYVVAKESEIVVGFIGFAQIFDEGHIMNLAVLPTFRRRGYGEKILNEMFRQGAERKITAYTLEVRSGNKGAIALYEKKGFVLSGVRKGYYGGKEDARIYWLYL